MDNKVVKDTHFVANISSLPYFAANNAVVEAAGIAIIRVDILVEKGSRFNRLHKRKQRDGIINNLIALMNTDPLQNISFKEMLDKITPIKTIVMGVRQLLNAVIVFSKKYGIVILHNIMIRPISTAQIHGFVKKVLNAFFLLIFTKQPSPKVHINMRKGIRCMEA